MHITHKKRARILLLLTSVVLIVVLSLMPIERPFITFATADDSYKYNHRGQVVAVVDGKITDLVIGKNNNIYSILIIPKSNTGWKLGLPLETKTIKKFISYGLEIRIYQYLTTDEYYISILDASGKRCEISDNKKSHFFEVENKENKLQTPIYTYYSFIEDFGEEYILSVNGNDMKISF